MILRSIDGKFYEIPDVELSKFLIPADKVQESLRASGASGQQAATGGMVQAYHGPPPPPPGPFIPVPNPLPFIFGPPPPPPPPVYYNYYNYRNYWGGW